MRNQAYKKILLSLSEDSRFIMDEKLEKVSGDTGHSQSRILEECIMLGFIALYDSEDIDQYKSIIKKRYGAYENFANTKYVDDLISVMKR